MGGACPRKYLLPTAIAILPTGLNAAASPRSAMTLRLMIGAGACTYD